MLLFNFFSWDVVSIPLNSLISPIYSWLLGNPFYHLWYLYMYLGLLFTTPLIFLMIDTINDNRTILRIGVSLLIMGFIIELTSSLFWILQFIPYLGYYILGYSMFEYSKKTHKSIRNLKYIIYWFLTSLLIFFSTLLMFTYNISFNLPFLIIPKLYFYNYLSPFVILSSLSLFYGFLNTPQIKFNLSFLSSKTFLIYLFHPAVLIIIGFLVNNIFNLSLFFANSISYIFIFTPLTFFISLFLAILTEKLIKIKILVNINKYFLNSIMKVLKIN